MAQARFPTLDQVAEELTTSRAQVYALLRRQELTGIKIGGRGVWRVERTKLEEFISRAYADTEAWLEANPDANIVDEAGTGISQKTPSRGAVC